jgi:COPII coat assembly protein SEC16
MRILILEGGDQLADIFKYSVLFFTTPSFAMSTESPNASWHPAFMPNSSSDIIATQTPELPQSTPLTPEPILEPSKPDLATPRTTSDGASSITDLGNDGLSGEVRANESSVETGETTSSKLLGLSPYTPPQDATNTAVEIQRPIMEAVADNEEHPELNNLRDALATSLASPGGVELNENPVHNGVSHPDMVEEDKADFPSKGPKHRNKHMSFARTVSDDVNWGEEDDVDSEWNIQRTDTDPFKDMAKLDRTNSFPDVPPAHLAQTFHPEESLPHSQAEDIMNQVEHESNDLFGNEGDDVEADFFARTSVTKEASGLSPEAEIEESERPFDYGQSYGGDLRQDEDQESEARYEEGLPLVQSVEHGSSSKPPSATDDEAEDDFFARVSKADQTHQEPPPGPQLERKSTMQIMDAMKFQPHIHAQHDVIQEEGMESSHGSLDKATGGGIGTSTSTVLSQVLSELDAATHNDPEVTVSLETETADDLAEKWKAALAGDEFLDDDEDELLPDDDELPAEKDTEGNVLDPAALFGSDDEGFLEDTDEQNTTDAFLQQANPPIPTPVAGLNGHIVGFDNLGGPAQMNRSGSSGRPGSSGTNRYLPPGTNTAASVPSNNYAPSGPMLTDLTRQPPTAAGPSPYMSPSMSTFPTQQIQRPEMPKAQSFADKSKGGYHSPYDLPMEVVKPRKRVSIQHMHPNYNNAPSASVPPPRSSSMYNLPSPPPRGSTSSLSPPTSSHGVPHSNVQPMPAPPSSGQPQGAPTKTVRKSQSGFFEELPMSTKPRLAPRHSSALSSPAQTPYGAPTPTHPTPPSVGRPPYAPTSVQQHPVQPPPPHQGLVAPERVSPYASLPSATVPAPAVATRYSPAPPPLNHSHTAPPPPVSQSRYSPAPPNPRQSMPSYHSAPSNQIPQSSQSLPHQPRTSSPLAHFERSQDPRSHGSYSETVSFDRRSSSSGYESNLRTSHLPPTREVDENEQPLSSATRHYGELQEQPPLPASRPLHTTHPASHTPPPSHGLTSRLVNSPPKRATANYQPQQHSTGPPQAFLPPQRSQTQSPGAAHARPRLEMISAAPYQRPASVEIPQSPRSNVGYSTIPTSASIIRPRGFSQGLNYIAPTDGREHDPLQRWKGAPVFAWGVGGTIMTSFPTDVPRYGINQVTPMIVRSPGEVKIRNIKEVDPLPERLTSFPGPLKGKAKKKEVIAWLASGIEILEQNASYLRSAPQLSHEDKRIEERILLWKILRVFIENDGTLEGNEVVMKAVRAVLSPGLDDISTNAPLYATGAELSGISRSANAPSADPVDPGAVEELRKCLLRGEREKAVWEAVDKRLWAHAMLISNTVSRELYKQVAQEFVQKEVKNIGDNTQSLAALYEIFAGNFEESIDELVPPSARAGFQMVSTSNAAGPSRDALDGLDRWRETLGLVLSNRSVDDSLALNALGKLLSGYGRAEAAHICFLFARSHSVFGGIDDPSSTIVLVGSDHLRQPHDFDREMEPILLSEVFEYGMALSNTSNLAISIPHLSVYKLQHATILAEYGYREKALQYCEAIATSITSQTKRSPYHHPLLVAAVDDLSKRLKQSPKDDSGSWIKKPTVEKATSSVFTMFNKFVAGDETEAAATGSNSGSANDVGPFARIAGGTPTISRSPSNAELYGSYNGGLGVNGNAAGMATKTASRYAPGAPYTPPNHEPSSAASYGSQPRSSTEERSSGEFRRYEPQRQMSQMSDYRPNSQPINPVNPPSGYTPQTSTSYMPQTSYTTYGNASSPYAESPYAPQPTTPVTEQAPTNIYSSPQHLNNYEGTQQPTAYPASQPSFSREASSSYEPPSLSGYEPPSSSYEPPASGNYEPPSANYEPPASSGYEPPSSGYEPPSYEPATMNDEPDSPVDTRPKKKSFMDDDDDDIPALKAAPVARDKTKAEKDREADEAFRRAAEADGMWPYSHFPYATNTVSSTKNERSRSCKEERGRLGSWRLVQRLQERAGHGRAAQQAHQSKAWRSQQLCLRPGAQALDQQESRRREYGSQNRFAPTAKSRPASNSERTAYRRANFYTKDVATCSARCLRSWSASGIAE